MQGLRQRLRRGDLLLGTMISEVRNPNVAHLLARAGFDFFIIDNEHGGYSVETVSAMVAAARGACIDVMVRIPEIRRETILKPLDAGAAGLLVPQVNTAEAARQVIFHGKYPPAGNRGVGLRRAHSRYQRVGAADYLAQANEDTVIAVQAETPEAISNLEGIAQVEWVDCIFVGPMDLSVSLGCPGRLDHPEEVAAIERVISVCGQHGIAPGIMLFDERSLGKWIDRGIRFAVYSSDISMLADGPAPSVSRLKARSGGRVDA